MDDKLKKDLAKIVGQGVQKGFEQNFQKYFDGSLKKAFDQLFEEKFIKLFNQGVDEVIIPEFNRMDKKFMELESKMAQGFDSVNNRLDNLAVKMDLMASKQSEDGYQIKNHEKRISKLESHRAVA